MKNALRLLVLVGVISLSWFAAERPLYAIQSCLIKDGAACSQPGANGLCSLYDEGMQCTWIYPCWCDQGYWRCGQSPTTGGSCGY